MAHMATDLNFDYGAVGARLRLLRTLLGYPTQGAFATVYAIGYSTWSAYENGKPLPQWAAIHLVQRIPGLTLDWIYFGNESGLSGKLLSKLSEIRSALPGKTG